MTRRLPWAGFGILATLVGMAAGHLGLVLAGRNRIEMDDGRVVEVGPGDLFEIGPGHDSVVVGDERYVSIHFLGAEQYSAT